MVRLINKYNVQLQISIALFSGAAIFSATAFADDILKERFTPATDLNQIPATAKLRKS